MRKLRVEIHSRVPLPIFQDIQKRMAIRETHFPTFSKSAVVRKYNDNLNGNRDANSECILLANTDRTLANGDFASRGEISPELDSQSFYGNKGLHNQRAKEKDDERKANTLITAEYLSALQDYLLFTTARDCSILMTFRELHP